MRGLAGKRVLITGGASGIGAASAVRFLEEGSQVVVLDRDEKGRAEIQRQLPKLTGAVAADVSNLAQVCTAFAEAVRLMGAVDVLINNAGISIRHNFLEITPEEWDKVVAVNLTGVFYVAQTAARHMWEQGGGVILQTASTNGIMGYPYYADYNATKAGVIELTRSMALELAQDSRLRRGSRLRAHAHAARRVHRRHARRSEPKNSPSPPRQARGDRGLICISCLR